MKTLVLVLLLLMPSWAYAELYKVQAARVVDGDTVRGYVELEGGWHYEGAIRSTYDAWESSRARRSLGLRSRGWEIENAKGRKAKRALSWMLSTGVLYVDLPDSKDLKQVMGVYGRLVGPYVIVRDAGARVDIGEWMEERGHLRK